MVGDEVGVTASSRQNCLGLVSFRVTFVSRVLMDRYEQKSTCCDALYKNRCLLCLRDKGGSRRQTS